MKTAIDGCCKHFGVGKLGDLAKVWETRVSAEDVQKMETDMLAHMTSLKSSHDQYVKMTEDA